MLWVKIVGLGCSILKWVWEGLCGPDNVCYLVWIMVTRMCLFVKICCQIYDLCAFLYVCYTRIKNLNKKLSNCSDYYHWTYPLATLAFSYVDGYHMW